ncbi:short chain dehydrogenase family protein [Aspergillus niger]|uniref:Short chain dehydrogenase family protein n=1 Tax=Aspergillus niger TaxID=5061 RepID=A0A505ITN2_ASPNG|nr:short chain dehydrogenase family protein [Aspergillus niger]
MRLLTYLLLTIYATSAVSTDLSVEEECGSLGVMKVDPADLPEGVTLADVRKDAPPAKRLLDEDIDGALDLPALAIAPAVIEIGAIPPQQCTRAHHRARSNVYPRKPHRSVPQHGPIFDDNGLPAQPVHRAQARPIAKHHIVPNIH